MAALSLITTIKPIIAVKTLEAINQAITADGGASFRKILRHTISQAEDAYSVESDKFRSHLGASIIGSDCLRQIWYMFRWANPEATFETKKIPHSQMIRLMNRGHLEEARFIALLLMIGCEVWQYDSNGKQYRILAHGGHFGGSGDGILRGIPDCPNIPLQGEFKTHNDDSFTKLVSAGVRESKPQHYVQMQMYMGGWGLTGGLYFAVNKDNDQLYAELVEFNPEIFFERSDKAKKIIESRFPPAKISESPGWWKCKMCRQRHLCHKIPLENDSTDRSTWIVPQPHRNCRTCVYSRPVDGGWICTNKNFSWNSGEGIPLTKKDQITGCELYTPIEM